MPSVIWSASTIFFFSGSFFSAGKSPGKIVDMSPACVQPCSEGVIGIIIIDLKHTVYEYRQQCGAQKFSYCIRRLKRSNRAVCCRRALRILLRALAAETLLSRELDSHRNGSPRDCGPRQGLQTAYDSYPTFWAPKNSKSPIQHAQQRSRRTSWIDYFKSTALPSCRQGASCRLVVPCWLHAHAEGVRRLALFLQQQAV